MEVGKHVVGLVLQLGYCSSRSWNVDAWVRRLDALITYLLGKNIYIILEVMTAGGGSKYSVSRPAFTVGSYTQLLHF